MEVKPIGNRILVELEKVEQTVGEGALAGFQLQSDNEQKREQDGQDMGKIVSFGPLAFVEDFDGGTAESRAKAYGVEVGDVVMFHRYDGERPRVDGYKNHRLISSNCLIGKVEK